MQWLSANHEILNILLQNLGFVVVLSSYRSLFGCLQYLNLGHHCWRERCMAGKKAIFSREVVRGV